MFELPHALGSWCPEVRWSESYTCRSSRGSRISRAGRRYKQILQPFVYLGDGARGSDNMAFPHSYCTLADVVDKQTFVSTLPSRY